MSQKFTPGYLFPENCSPWFIINHEYAHCHGDRLTYGKSRYPSLGEMISRILWYVLRNTMQELKAA